MKLPLLIAAVCSLVCSSCQNVQWPWKKADAAADPYAAAAGQYNAYPQQPNYTQPPAQDPNAPNYSNTYNTGGEQAQVYPANGAGATQPNYNAGAPDWNAGVSTKPAAATGGGGGRSYTVVRGDTQYGIARRYGISVTKLQQANGLNTSNLQIGQRLRIP